MATPFAALLDLAERLAEGQSLLGIAPEVLYRTTVSRAYYAAYHCGRAFMGIGPANRMSHGALMARVRDTGDAGRDIANNLRALYIMREEADYGLDLDITRNDAVNALALCRELMAQFERQR